MLVAVTFCEYLIRLIVEVLKILEYSILSFFVDILGLEILLNIEDLLLKSLLLRVLFEEDVTNRIDAISEDAAREQKHEDRV